MSEIDLPNLDELMLCDFNDDFNISPDTHINNLNLDTDFFDKYYKLYFVEKRIYKKCRHNKLFNNCKHCNPNYYCIHGKYKLNCFQCIPKRCCEHNILRYSCKICNPKIICEHGSRKYNCTTCCPYRICVHERRLYHCKICNNKLYSE
jgi:hypothetical protein